MAALQTALSCASPATRDTDQTAPPAPAAELSSAPRPLELPAPPFPAEAPPIRGTTLTLNAHALFDEATIAEIRGRPDEASTLAEGAVLKGGRGRLILARIAAARGERAPAIHWLQRAAIEEGVDPEVVRVDPKFDSLRRDPRWPRLFDFLERASAYWASQPRRDEYLVVPSTLGRRGAAVRIVVALPESGGDPADFVDQARYRGRAEELAVVFAGISPPVPLGPMAYRWSSDEAENLRRVSDALASLRARFDVRDGQVLLLGFGEGGHVAVQAATHDPGVYAGAIALSPGGLPWDPDELAGRGGLGLQRYVVAVGTFESLDTLGTSYVDASRLREAGARVILHSSWLYARHTLPPDFDVQLPHWIEFVLTGVQG